MYDCIIFVTVVRDRDGNRVFQESGESFQMFTDNLGDLVPYSRTASSRKLL